jgi:triosephosphate isomerase
MHEFIRETVRSIRKRYRRRCFYSLWKCKPENAKEIFSKPDVDGGLIGGAALKSDDS